MSYVSFKNSILSSLNISLSIDGLHDMFNLLINSVYSLADTVDTFKVNEKNIKSNLEKNPIIATKLNETIGDDLASKIVKEAYKTNKSIIDITEEKTNLTRSQILKLLDPKKLI